MTETQGDRIKKIRKHFKLSQQDLADDINIKQPSIAYIEKKGAASSDVMINISNFYKVSLDWLMKGEGEMIKSESKTTPQSANNPMEIAERMANDVRDDYKERIAELKEMLEVYKGLLKKHKIVN